VKPALLLLLLLAATPAQARLKLAVLDVRATGTVSKERVEGLSALIASEVARASVGDVLSGADLRAMLGFERQRDLLGCGDASCLAEIGGALGVDYLVSSEVSVVGETWLLSMALVEIRKAHVAQRLTKQTQSENELVNLTSLAADELLQPLLAQAPRPRSKVPAYVAWGLGVVAAGVGTAALIDAAGTSAKVHDGTVLGSATLTGTEAQSLSASGVRTRNLGWGLAGGAAVLGLVGMVLYPSGDVPPPGTVARF
jgi:hypothetical protein